jgi:hypothetical protein
MDLPRNCIKLNPDIKPPDLSQIQGQKIKKEGPISLGIDGDHLAFNIFFGGTKYILEIRRFSAEAATIINDLTLNFIFAEIDERH